MDANPFAIGSVRSAPRHVITVGVKDLFDVIGEVTTSGSRLRASREIPAAHDAALVGRLREAGAVIVAKTNLVEGAFGTSGVNPWFGTPVNPYGAELIPGGSSSGSAVGVKLGAFDFGLGTDTGGSVRIPAACTGTVGLKTTAGLFSLVGCRPLAPTLDTAGPLARTVGDLARMWSFLTGDVIPREPDVRVIQLMTGDSVRDAVISKVWGTRIAATLGARELDLAELHREGSVVLLYEAAHSLADLWREHHRVDPLVAARLKSAREISRGSYEHALGVRDTWRRRVDALLVDGETVFVLPTLPCEVPSFSTCGRFVLNAWTLPFNFLGLPALSHPVGTQLGGPVPFSSQIVGAPFGEPRLISVARSLEDTV